jgi:hypothetical protein
VDAFFLRRQERYYPKWLYKLVADMFAIVQHWELCATGPARGRTFENIFCRYCDYRHLSLTERAGARTLRHGRSASGFAHETDAVIGTPSTTVHLELKYLASPLVKNELLIFNQKGMDFLLGTEDCIRRAPFYRVLLSGEILTPEARRFALQWGIIVIEPDRLPLLMVHELAGRLVPNLLRVDLSSQDEIWTEMPKLLSPLHAKIGEFSRISSQGVQTMRRFREDRALDFLQRVVGDHYWMALDMSDPQWLERRYEVLSRILGLDWSSLHISGRN